MVKNELLEIINFFEELKYPATQILKNPGKNPKIGTIDNQNVYVVIHQKGEIQVQNEEIKKLKKFSRENSKIVHYYDKNIRNNKEFITSLKQEGYNLVYNSK